MPSNSDFETSLCATVKWPLWFHNIQNFLLQVTSILAWQCHNLFYTLSLNILHNHGFPGYTCTKMPQNLLFFMYIWFLLLANFIVSFQNFCIHFSPHSTLLKHIKPISFFPMLTCVSPVDFANVFVSLSIFSLAKFYHPHFGKPLIFHCQMMSN